MVGSPGRRWPKWLPILVTVIILFQLHFLIHIDIRNSYYLQSSAVAVAKGWRKAFDASATVEPWPWRLHSVNDGDFRQVGSGDITIAGQCEEWLEERDRIHNSRNFSKEPIRVAHNEHQGWSSCPIGCVFRNSDEPDAVFGLRGDTKVASVSRSMESSLYYPENDLSNARGRGYTVVMTTSLLSDVPVGYFSWAEYDIMSPVQEKTEKALAAAFISNCGAHNFRLEAITKLQKYGVTVDSYGACLHNKDGKGIKKVEALRRYRFSLAFENSNEEDYVTEKFWQSLVAGTVPVVVGAPNIQDFAPASNSLLHIKDINDIEFVAKEMKRLASDAAAYNETTRWKFEGPSDAFKALIDISVVHSSCRLCIYLGTKIREQEENLELSSHSRPCKCSDGEKSVYHLYVRERGKFEMESVFLKSDKMSMEGLHEAIITKFASLNYVPIWKAERPKELRGSADDPLRIYKVYPVGLTQREALYTWKFQDVKSFVQSNPCAKLEVIFV